MGPELGWGGAAAERAVVEIALDLARGRKVHFKDK
jgi:hypothetical protein